jgi:hypothetical protein
MLLPAHLPLAALASFGAFELLGLLFSIWMIVECIKREVTLSGRVLWLLLILFIPGLGPLVYFFVRVVRLQG